MRISRKLLLDALKAKEFSHENHDWVADGVAIDSRELKPNNLFVAIKGKNYDSHDFLYQAKDRGAVAALVTKIVNVSIPQILVKNSVEALQKLATVCRQNFTGTVIAITGSIGKTTIREMIAFLLGFYGKVSSACKNFNNHIGLPFTILNADDESNYLILEMGMNHLGELSLLTNIAKPDLAIVSNVEMVHIEYFDSLQEIVQAKSEIFQGLTQEGWVVLDKDGDFYSDLRSQASTYTNNVFTIGLGDKSDLFLCASVGEKIELKFGDNTYLYEVSVEGQHLIKASMMAVAVLIILKKDLTLVLNKIQSFQPLQGRGKITKECYNGKLITVIDESYNSSFPSLKNAIEVLSRIAAERRVAIIGDILELGSFAVFVHESILHLIQSSKVDILITVGDNMRVLSEAFKCASDAKNVPELHHFNNVEPVLEMLEETIRAGDAILVKGSNAIKLNKLVAMLKTKKTDNS